MSNQEQWEQDKKEFGNNAFKMWEICAYSENTPVWNDPTDNQDVEVYLKDWPSDVRRKESAALPFDLERAKAGDVVEIYANNYWKKCQSKIFENRKYPLIQLDNISVSEHFLRMKYPPKQEMPND